MAGVLLAVGAIFSGFATVVDGDTVRVGTVRVRLFGIDAPELSQRCGQAGVQVACGEAAARWLRDRVQGRRLDCAVLDRDRYQRVVARCRLDGRDVGAAVVAAGWATAYRRYGTDYVADETRAHNARLGIWALGFQAPDEYRRARIASRPPQTPPRQGCLVKGNIGASGARIYHLPGSRDYAAVGIDEARGERWFCSPAEAVAAGWRPVR